MGRELVHCHPSESARGWRVALRGGGTEATALPDLQVDGHVRSTNCNLVPAAALRLYPQARADHERTRRRLKPGLLPLLEHVGAPPQSQRRPLVLFQLAATGEPLSFDVGVFIAINEWTVCTDIACIGRIVAIV